VLNELAPGDWIVKSHRQILTSHLSASSA